MAGPTKDIREQGMNDESRRLQEAHDGKEAWKKWGPEGHSIINGRLKPGGLSREDFAQIIDEELASAASAHSGE